MTHEQLDLAHIGTGFEQVRGEAMAQRMRRDRLVDAGHAVSLLAGLRYGVSTNRPAGNIAREQPLLWVGGLPVSAQDLEQLILSISGVPKLQLSHWPRLGMILPKPLSKDTPSWRCTGRN